VCYTPSSEPFRIYLYNRYGPGIYPSFRKLERLKIHLAKTLNHVTFLMRCKSQAISPKGFSVKTAFNSRRTSKIIQRASRLALLRDRIHFHWRNKASLLQKIQELEDFIKSSLAISDQQRIFTAVESSFRKIFNNPVCYTPSSEPFRIQILSNSLFTNESFDTIHSPSLTALLNKIQIN
jgi:hypothetical protein